MSYTQTLRETLYVRAHYSYPASEHGGSGSVTVAEPIIIRVTVFDEPFQKSVAVCNGSLLTVDASLLASAEAQAKAKAKAAKAISTSVVGGFFRYNRADFDQKRKELENQISTDVPKLLTFLQRLREMRSRMESDFNLISARYIKIFRQFDDELSREIRRMYGPCFDLVEDCFDKIVSGRFLDLVSRSVGFNDVNLKQSLLVMTLTKSKLRQAMKRMEFIIMKLRRLDRCLDAFCDEKKNVKSVVSEYLPAVVFQLSNDEGGYQTECELPSGWDGASSEKVRSRVLESVVGGEVDLRQSDEDHDLVEIDFMKRLSTVGDERKRKEMIRLWENYKKGR